MPSLPQSFSKAKNSEKNDIVSSFALALPAFRTAGTQIFIALVPILVFVFIADGGRLFAEEAAQVLTDSTLVETHEQVTPVETAGTLIEEARQLIGMGDVSEAEQLLDEALSIEQDMTTLEKTKEAVGQLNMEVFFSKRVTEGTEMYEVKPGDALAKIARKYKTTVEQIMKSNGLKNTLIRPGDKLKVSSATYAILVDKSDRTLTLQRNGKFFKQYKVAVGKPGSETPVGTFSIDNKLENPTWFHAGAVVPPDSPENILGTRWLGFSIRGYGIHGTTLPETIGTDSTLGCIRMYNKDAEEIYAIVPVGIWVTVTE